MSGWLSTTVVVLLVAVLLKATERFTVAAEGAVTSRRCAKKVHHRAADRSRARSDAQHSRTSIDSFCSPLIFATQVSCELERASCGHLDDGLHGDTADACAWLARLSRRWRDSCQRVASAHQRIDHDKGRRA